MTIVDRVTLAAAAAEEWLDRLRTEYAPGASDRGMRLASACWSYVGPDAVEVTVQWQLPDVAAFWAMRRAAAQDTTVSQWWAQTDAVAISRQRNVCATA